MLSGWSHLDLDGREIGLGDLHKSSHKGTSPTHLSRFDCFSPKSEFLSGVCNHSNKLEVATHSRAIIHAMTRLESDSPRSEFEL